MALLGHSCDELADYAGLVLCDVFNGSECERIVEAGVAGGRGAWASGVQQRRKEI